MSRLVVSGSTAWREGETQARPSKILPLYTRNAEDFKGLDGVVTVVAV